MFWWRFRHNQKAMIGGIIVLLLIACAIFAPLIAPMDPNDGELSASLAAVGEKGYALGTDKNGRDVLSRLIYGSRTALGGALRSIYGFHPEKANIGEGPFLITANHNGELDPALLALCRRYG